MNAIDLKNTTKIYRKGFRALKVPAVVDLSMSVKKGLITGFVGPNGAGKTTTIKMIIGLVLPSSGTVTINGISSNLPKSRTGVAYLSEQPYLYAHLSVVESLQFASSLMKLSPDIRNKEIERVLSIVGLSDRERTKVKEMSKGMQQRLNMAIALLGDPHTYILDEPMSGMDPPGRRLFRNIFKDLGSRGKTVFFSTHVLDDIEAVCDEVIVLSKGKLAYCGAVGELLDRGFLGTDLVIDGVDKDTVDLLVESGCTVESFVNGTAHLFLPAEKDTSTIQKQLYSKNITFRQISTRSKSMEEILYKSAGEKSQ
ncbi:MAG: ABC transporter ATP-binding protein [Fibrobacter sp.]|nr:ABC transporter ATP-binding protein [Fibrobacter sp.]